MYIVIENTSTARSRIGRMIYPRISCCPSDARLNNLNTQEKLFPDFFANLSEFGRTFSGMLTTYVVVLNFVENNDVYFK